MGTSRRAWEQPSRITTATGGWIYLRPTSPMTHRPSTAMTAKEFFLMLPSPRDSVYICNTWAGAPCFLTSTTMAGPISFSPTDMSTPRWTSITWVARTWSHAFFITTTAMARSPMYQGRRDPGLTRFPQHAAWLWAIFGTMDDFPYLSITCTQGLASW